MISQMVLKPVGYPLTVFAAIRAQGTVLCVDTEAIFRYDNQGDMLCQDRHEGKSECGITHRTVPCVQQNPEDAVRKCVKPMDIVYPDPENTKHYRVVFNRYKKLHDALIPLYHSQE